MCVHRGPCVCLIPTASSVSIRYRNSLWWYLHRCRQACSAYVCMSMSIHIHIHRHIHTHTGADDATHVAGRRTNALRGGRPAAAVGSSPQEGEDGEGRGGECGDVQHPHGRLGLVVRPEPVGCSAPCCSAVARPWLHVYKCRPFEECVIMARTQRT